MRALFWLFVAAFNLVGIADHHATRIGLPAIAGQLGAAYAIPILLVPLLMLTNLVALYWLVRPQARTALTTGAS